CPKMNSNLQMLKYAFRQNAKMSSAPDTAIQFISISIDPARDSVRALREYALQRNINGDHWWFLTGDKDSIYHFGHEILRLKTGAKNSGAEELMHSDRIVLIDGNNYVR